MEPPSLGENPENPPEYETLDILGSGMEGPVYKIKIDNQFRALKTISKSSDHYCVVKNEINIHSTLTHPNIVLVTNTWDDKHNMYMVMEICDISLYELEKELIKNSMLMNEKDFLVINRDVLKGLVYLHFEASYAHRDVKPENVLFHGKSDRWKLTDFGFADEANKYHRNTPGTLEFAAPEMLQYTIYPIDLYHGPPVDIWALGIMGYEMLFGIVPYRGQTQKCLHKNIMDTTLKFKGRGKNLVGMPGPLGAKKVDKSIQRFLECSLERDPYLRINAKEGLRHVENLIKIIK